MSSFHLPVIVDIGYYLPWLISTQYPFTWVCLKNYAKKIPEFGKSLPLWQWEVSPVFGAKSFDKAGDVQWHSGEDANDNYS